MKDSLRKLLSKRGITLVLAVLLALTAFNTYLILQVIPSSNSANMVDYDFVLSQDGNNYRLKNMLTGYIRDVSTSASSAINTALAEGNSLYINPGTYVLDEDVLVLNKISPRIVSDGATIIGNGKRIIVTGDDHTTSRYAFISGLTFINGTIRVEDSFRTTITDMIFANTSTGIEFANTKTWSEYNKVENSQFINATEGIVFRTPTGNATGSYASSEINRCSFNLMDFSVGIKVEALAEFSDSQMTNVRFWLGENGRANQTALLVDGSMFQTLLLGVVFESFTDDPVYLFAIDIGENCDPAPILDGGVSFLGNWTARVHNPFSKWISGVGSVFDMENIDVPVGLNNQYGSNKSLHIRPLKIFSFRPKIQVSGSFANNETITVRIRLELIDNVITKSVVRTFNADASVWLTDDEMLQLLPSQNLIWAIVVDAKTSAASTDAFVRISGYGTAG